MPELRIHGRGGQGVVTLAELLARVAMAEGHDSQTMPFFGVERRGAAVRTSVRISDKPIKLRSQSTDPDTLVLMSANMLPYALADGEHEKAAFVVNAADFALPGHDVWTVDASAIAVKHSLIFGGQPYANVPMLGALCRVLGLPKEKMTAEIENQWPGAKAKPNIDAALEAYDAVSLKGGAE